uniref:Reverse transcriptase domain-containing protein n=1 Tax=Tanacetum cinerariifolium TaxID=118510 RepID=A0A6L2JT84_TANCI|nr:hypothetical protein [Tanacetum cinerariifolium]
MAASTLKLTVGQLRRVKSHVEDVKAGMSKDMSGQESLALSWRNGARPSSQGTKETPRKLVYIDSEKEALDGSMTKGFSDRFSIKFTGTSDTRSATHSPGKGQKGLSKGKEPSRLRRPKPTSFTPRIPHFKYYRRAKLPRNIMVYEGNKDPKDHLSIFSAAAEQEEWPLPIWCKMFHQTIGGAARNWFDDLDPKSVEKFKELSHKFLEEFSLQKRYAKDPIEIYGIKRRQNEAFMHGHGHSELAKKLNDKIPKMVDEMFERVRAFLQGEMAAGLAEMIRPFQGDKGNTRPVWSKGQERTRNRNGPRERNLKSGNQRRNDVKVINMIARGRNRKRPYEEERSSLTEELTFLAILWNGLTDEPIVLEGMIEGHQNRRIHVDSKSSSEIMVLKRNISLLRVYRPMGNHVRGRKEQTMLVEFVIVKCRSPYNILVIRTRMRSPNTVVSTIHSMIKFPTERGVVTMKTSRETLWEYRQLEKCWARGKKHNGVSTWNKCKEYENKHYCKQGTTLDRDLKTSIEGKSVLLAKGRDSQKGPVP